MGCAFPSAHTPCASHAPPINIAARCDERVQRSDCTRIMCIRIVQVTRDRRFRAAARVRRDGQRRMQLRRDADWCLHDCHVRRDSAGECYFSRFRLFKDFSEQSTSLPSGVVTLIGNLVSKNEVCVDHYYVYSSFSLGRALEVTVMFSSRIWRT